jgi:hypothetical protein
MSTPFHILDESKEMAFGSMEAPLGLHIGQRSAGWRFLFRAHPNQGITSVSDWKRVLQGKKIATLYGEIYSEDEFWAEVETHKGRRLHSTGSHPIFSTPYINEGEDFALLDACFE